MSLLRRIHRRQSAMQCKADQSQRSHCLLGHINVPSKHHVSFHGFSIETQPFTCVCFSQIVFPVSAVVRHSFMVSRRKTLLSPSWVSEETKTLHFIFFFWKDISMSPSGSCFLRKCIAVWNLCFSLRDPFLGFCLLPF